MCDLFHLSVVNKYYLHDKNTHQYCFALHLIVLSLTLFFAGTGLNIFTEVEVAPKVSRLPQITQILILNSISNSIILLESILLS